jgi:hypothetical protein
MEWTYDPELDRDISGISREIKRGLTLCISV